MALVFAVMHLYNIFLISFVHSFFILKKSGIDKSTEWSTIPACPSLMCIFFLTGVIPKGLILRKFCVRCFCMFYVNLCAGLILCVCVFFNIICGLMTCVQSK